MRRPARLAALLILAATAHAGTIGATPFGTVLEGLLARFHAVVVPCAPSAVPPVACFVVEPGHAAVLAEVLERFVADHGGALRRGPWASANGTHRVLLTLDDAAWGALEVWLTEQPGHRVVGRVEHLPKRRW